MVVTRAHRRGVPAVRAGDVADIERQVQGWGAVVGSRLGVGDTNRQPVRTVRLHKAKCLEADVSGGSVTSDIELPVSPRAPRLRRPRAQLLHRARRQKCDKIWELKNGSISLKI